MEKDVWERPRVVGQMFEANEYVAACYSLYCEVAGKNHKFVGDAYFDEDVHWDGKLVKADRQLHGQPCADGSSYNTSTHTFYENSKPVSSVDSVSIGTPLNSSTWYATWGSTDGSSAQTGHYTHYGWAVLDNPNKPNHS